MILAHLEVLARGPSYAGPLLPADHLFDLGLSLLALALFVAAGRPLLRATGLEPERPLEALLYASAVGAGLWSTLFLLLGGLGLLTPLGIGAAVLGGVLLCGRELERLPAAVRSVVRDVRAGGGDRWWLGLAGAVTAGAALFLVVHGSAPPGDWDSLMYHLEIPRRWLAEGRIFLPEDNLHAAYVGLVQVLYLPFLAAGSPAAAALLNGLFALLLGAAAFAVGRRLLDPDTASLSAALVWASTGLLLVAISARVDTTLAFFLLLGHGSVAAAVVEPSRTRSHLLLAAAVLGLAAGAKYHALAYTAALAPVGLWALARADGPLARRGGTLALAAVAFAAAVLPWVAKNQLLLGAPFYPFFTERLLQPWLAGLYGSASVMETVGAGASGALGQARERFDLVALFLAPERLTVEPEAVHYNLNPLLLLLPLWLLHWRRRAVAALAVPALLYAAGVAVLRPSLNLRYLFPAIAPLTVATTFLAVGTLRRFAGEEGPGPLGSRALRRVVLATLAVVALLPTARSTVAWTGRAPVLGQAVGSVSAEDYLAAGFSFYAGLAGTVNRSVPSDGRVLLLWEARGFYLAPPHLQDNVLTNWPYLEPYLERHGSCLEESDITHVLASTAAARYYERRGTEAELLGLDSFERFADRCLEPVDGGGGYTLYRVPGA